MDATLQILGAKVVQLQYLELVYPKLIPFGAPLDRFTIQLLYGPQVCLLASPAAQIPHLATRAELLPKYTEDYSSTHRLDVTSRGLQVLSPRAGQSCTLHKAEKEWTVTELGPAPQHEHPHLPQRMMEGEGSHNLIPDSS